MIIYEKSNLCCNNLCSRFAASNRVFTNTLNFEVNKYYGEKIVSLQNGILPFILEEKQGELSVVIKPSGVVLALQTNNIEETLVHLKSKNAHFIVDEPTTCPPGKFITFTDPFGNIIEYLQFV